MQKAWADADVPQCGYCQSGQMAYGGPAATKPKPTEADIDSAMSMVICRCGTYTRIRADLAAAEQGALTMTNTSDLERRTFPCNSSPPAVVLAVSATGVRRLDACRCSSPPVIRWRHQCT